MRNRPGSGSSSSNKAKRNTSPANWSRPVVCGTSFTRCAVYSVNPEAWVTPIPSHFYRTPIFTRASKSNMRETSPGAGWHSTSSCREIFTLWCTTLKNTRCGRSKYPFHSTSRPRTARCSNMSPVRTPGCSTTTFRAWDWKTFKLTWPVASSPRPILSGWSQRAVSCR
ncbi:hypothetical protein D3C73_1192200 [compost metagenome]